MRTTGPESHRAFGRHVRRRTTRISALASVTALTALLAPVPAAYAQPATAAEELPEELTTAIARDLGYSAQEYLERAERAQQLHDFTAAYRTRNPDSYAGAWLDADGQPVVAVTTDEAAGEISARGYQAQRAVVSANVMQEALTQLVGWIEDLPQDVAKSINGIALDTVNNQIIVQVVNSPLGQLLNLPTLLANVRITPVPAAPQAMASAIGGDSFITSAEPLDSPNTLEVTVCSLGFSATAPDGGNAYITAGHCDPLLDTGYSGAPVYLPNPAGPAAGSGPQVGSIVSSRVGGDSGVEYSIISVNEAGVAAGLDQPAVRGGGGSSVPVTGVGAAVVGAPICKSGKSSSYTCGVVTADHVEVPLYLDNGTTRTISGFAGSTCSLAGDSGGAIISGTLALGITSGSNSGDSANCGEAALALAATGGTSTVGIPVGDITAATGVRVRTAPSAD